MKKTIIFLVILLMSYPVYPQVTPVHGVTIDGISPISDITTSLQKMPVKMTTRIVFDEWIAASNYVSPCNSIHNVSYIMGEILDSYYMKDYTTAQYTARTTEYLNALGNTVDIWEVGNEINGEWLGATSDVVAKMTGAYNIIHNAGKQTELTLYYNYNCWANSNNEMFKWVNTNVPSYMKTGLDYVLISYYEDDCNGYQPNWQQVFDQLHTIFPNAKIGIGECGTATASNKAAYMQRYYTMNITTPNYVGGYFWWYYRQDCTPYTQPLWTTLYNILNTAPQLTAPALLSPVNGATNVSTAPVLDWSDVTNASSYQVQVSTSSAFTATVVNQANLTASTYTVPTGILAAGTTYYWRANASNTSGTSAWSVVFSFTTAAAPPQLTAPTLLSPVNGATNVSTTPVLDWSDVTNASSYQVQVSTTSAFTTTVVNQANLTASTYTVPTGILIAGTIYYWRANASNTSGTSPWSAVFSFTTAAVPPPVTQQVRGVTIDGIYPTADIVTSLSNLPVRPTTRIIFDNTSASAYSSVVTSISNVSDIMGDVLDSYYMNNFTVKQYRSRLNDYVYTLGNKVTIWEVANEYNSESVGSISKAASMLSAGYNYVKSLNKKTAITLLYNSYCYTNPANQVFTWANNNIPAYIRNGLDYVWLSYYDDDCGGYQPNWQQVFDSLHVMFPNSKIGIGMCGTLDPSKKAAYMQKYYTINITTPNYVGGYFWWTFREDCVPYTQPLWTTLAGIFTPPDINNITLNAVNNNNVIVPPKEFQLKQNYPNPFNPSTKISYSLPAASNVKLVIYDLQGREVTTLTNEYLQAGEHSVEFNASNLASGVYIYKIEAGKFSSVKRMILIK